MKCKSFFHEIAVFFNLIFGNYIYPCGTWAVQGGRANFGIAGWHNAWSVMHIYSIISHYSPLHSKFDLWVITWHVWRERSQLWNEDRLSYLGEMELLDCLLRAINIALSLPSMKYTAAINIWLLFWQHFFVD